MDLAPGYMQELNVKGQSIHGIQGFRDSARRRGLEIAIRNGRLFVLRRADK